jgi:predicted RNase H-like HicB family nuclease
MAIELYTALIYRNAGEFGVTFPDFPGCITVGTTLDHAARQAREALSFHIEGMVKDGDDLPAPTPLDSVQTDPEYPEIARMLVEVDIPGKVQRINVTMEESLLARIDRAAAARGMTRSAFLAAAAKREMVAA